MSASVSSPASSPASSPTRSVALWFVGFVAGSLVNFAGVAAALVGAGLWVYGVVLVVGVTVGAAAWLSPRAKWYGVGLVTGVLAELAIMVSLVLLWSHAAGNSIQ